MMTKRKLIRQKTIMVSGSVLTLSSDSDDDEEDDEEDEKNDEQIIKNIVEL